MVGPADDELDCFLARYDADRVHELELDKISSQYEVAFIQSGVILNGLAAAGLVGFLGATIDKIELRNGLWIAGAAFACWLLGLSVAVWSGNTAYEAQKSFVGAIRNRRHTAGYHLLGPGYSRLFGTNPKDTPDMISMLARTLTNIRVIRGSSWRIREGSPACYYLQLEARLGFLRSS